MAARSISCRAWPAATSTFFGVQPRFGQVPPRSCDSIIATDMPARRTGPVTPMPALPPPRITTSNVSGFIELPRALLSGRDGRDDRADHRGRHPELGDAIADVVTPGNPFEIGPDRP